MVRRIRGPLYRCYRPSKAFVKLPNGLRISCKQASLAPASTYVPQDSSRILRPSGGSGPGLVGCMRGLGGVSILRSIVHAIHAPTTRSKDHQCERRGGSREDRGVQS
jgi:hypothetical protein